MHTIKITGEQLDFLYAMLEEAAMMSRQDTDADRAVELMRVLELAAAAPAETWDADTYQRVE